MVIFAVQLPYRLVADTVWSIYYAAASDPASPAETSTANSIINPSFFAASAISPALLGCLIVLGGDRRCDSGIYALLPDDGSVSSRLCAAGDSNRTSERSSGLALTEC